VHLTLGLHRAVRHQPDNIATIFGARRRTFRELADRVARLAGALQQLGARDDDRIAILSLNSDRFIEYYLAVWWAGCVVNPVNTRWAVPEIVYSLEDSNSSILFVDKTYSPMVDAIRAGAKSIKHIIYLDDDEGPLGALRYEDIMAKSEPVEDAYRKGDDTCGIFYTGGTTGFPKGVILSHTNMGVPSMTFLCEEYGFGDVVLHTSAMFHAAPLLFIIAQLLNGGRHVIIPGFDPKAVVETIVSEGVTDAMLVPSMVQVLVNHPVTATGDYSKLKRIWYGGSTIPEAVQRKALDMFAPSGLVQLYGMTEIPVSSLLSPAFHAPEKGKLRSTGRAAQENEIKIADENGREVPRGVVGEVVVRGLNVMKGYLNKPEETAKTIRNGWLHTGDAAYMDDQGFIFIADRIKDMIVTGGENVYAAEVENAIATHPSVATVAVIGVPDEQWGEGIHAVVVLKSGAAEFSSDELRKHCRNVIAGYKCPRSLEFTDALPLSAFGKVTKNVLRDRYKVRLAKV
jgi:acyl-CoA synthetase (AMP-forming)/AMP-acid ligase II